MWVYEVRTRRWKQGDRLVATGYSGFGPHRDKPESETLAGLGPIPAGVYWIGQEYDSKLRGPVVLPLLPAIPPHEVVSAVPGAQGTDTHGRSAFLIHGDSKEHPGEASHGCIILPRPIRERIADSRDRLLVVVTGDEPAAASA